MKDLWYKIRNIRNSKAWCLGMPRVNSGTGQVTESLGVLVSVI
jgi:hypothetical protein